MLHQGKFGVTLLAELGDFSGIVDASLELKLPGNHPVLRLGLADATVSPDRIHWVFDQPELMFALELSIAIESSAPLRIAMPLMIQEVTQSAS
jgi:hypothetical protein